ncbi:MAG: YtxH domain-containing protein [Actinomycetota bacterium]
MRYKMTFVAGLATGYVLGAKAGRIRYEQISRMATTLWSRPIVQGATESLSHKASNLVEGAKSSVKSSVSHRVGGRDVTNHWVDPTPSRN